MRAHTLRGRTFGAGEGSRQAQRAASPSFSSQKSSQQALIACPLGTKSQVFAEAYSSSENFEASLDRRLNEGRAGLSRACELGSSVRAWPRAPRRPPLAYAADASTPRAARFTMKSACFRSLSCTCNRPVTAGDPRPLSPIQRVHTLSPSSWAPSAGVTATRIHLRVTKQTLLS